VFLWVPSGQMVVRLPLYNVVSIRHGRVELRPVVPDTVTSTRIVPPSDAQDGKGNETMVGYHVCVSRGNGAAVSHTCDRWLVCGDRPLPRRATGRRRHRPVPRRRLPRWDGISIRRYDLLPHDHRLSDTGRGRAKQVAQDQGVDQTRREGITLSGQRDPPWESTGSPERSGGGVTATAGRMMSS